MKHIYDFNLKEFVNIDLYIDFFEIFLKDNHILKKDFFAKIDICANSYRFFLSHREKNRYYYYDIISNAYNMYLPKEEEFTELSNEYSKIIEDILYRRLDQLEANRKIIDDVRLRNNSDNDDKIHSMEVILFEGLNVLLSLNLDKIEDNEKIEILQKYLDKVSPYEPILPNIFMLIHVMNLIYYNALTNKVIVNDLMDKAFSLVQNYQFLEPFLYKVISDAYVHSSDYINAILFRMKSYDGFIQVYNFQSAIPIKIETAYIYNLMGSYYNASQTLNQMYLSLNTFEMEHKKSICRGIIEADICLGKFKSAYKFMEKNEQYLDGLEYQIEKLYVLLKLRMFDQFHILYDLLIDKKMDDSYKSVLFGIYSLLDQSLKKHTKLKEFSRSVQQINDITFRKICKIIFDLKK